MNPKLLSGLVFTLLAMFLIILAGRYEITEIRDRDNELINGPYKVGSVQTIDSGKWRYGVMITSRRDRP